MRLFNVFKNISRKLKSLDNTSGVLVSNCSTTIDTLISTFEDTYENDYVIETGTSGSWTYRKWESGKSECWGYPSVSTAISSSYGKMYYAGAYTFTFPSGLFVASPIVNITMERNGGLLFSSIYSGNKDEVRPYIASATGESSATIWFHIRATGRWKALDTFS